MTLVSMDEEQIFHYALGKFVSQFARAENMLFMFLGHVVGIDHRTLTILASGAKIDACISFIRRTHDAHNVAISDQIDDALARLATINNVRNDLLHYGMMPNFTVSTVLKALPNKGRTYRVTTEDLSDAEYDLAKITFMFSAAMNTVIGPPHEIQAIQQVIASPWRYKPPQQENTRHEPPKNPSRRQRQRNASQKSR